MEVVIIELVDRYPYDVYYDNKDQEYVVIRINDKRRDDEERYEYQSQVLAEDGIYYLDFNELTKKDLQNVLCGESFDDDEEDDDEEDDDEEHGNGVREQITRAIKKFWQNEDNWKDLCKYLRISIEAESLCD